MEFEAADDVVVIEEQKEEFATPDMYRVIMHNDNYTTMEFVVGVLVSVFKKATEDAVQLMLKIHKAGCATVGVYSYDVAYTRVQQVYKLAERYDFPLKCSILKDTGDDR